MNQKTLRLFFNFKHIFCVSTIFLRFISYELCNLIADLCATDQGEEEAMNRSLEKIRNFK